MALDHIGFCVNDFDRSLEFYERILKPLGNRRVMLIENENYRACGFGKQQPTFWIHGSAKGKNDNNPSDSQEDNQKIGKSFHIAFAASSRRQVDKFYEVAIAEGGRDNGKPGFRKYHPFYYAAFVIDFDGNNIEAVNHFEFSWKLWLPVSGIVIGVGAVVYRYFF